MPLIDIVLNSSNRNSVDIALSDFDNIFTKAKTFLKSFYSENKKIRFRTLTGSFVMRFNLNNDNNLFIESQNVENLLSINNLLKDTNAHTIIEKLKSKKNVKKYIDFVSTFKNLEDDVKIISAAPNYIQPDILNLDKSHLDNVIQNLSIIDNMEEITYNIEGELIAIDHLKQKLSIKNESGIYNIKYSEIEISPDDSFTTHCIYLCKIKEMKSKHNNAKEKSIYILNSINKY